MFLFSLVFSLINPTMAAPCEGGISGADTHMYRAQVVGLFPQFKPGETKTCGEYQVRTTSGRICSFRGDEAEMICTTDEGTPSIGPDICHSLESALAEQVERLEACPGITPVPAWTPRRPSRSTSP